MIKEKLQYNIYNSWEVDFANIIPIYFDIAAIATKTFLIKIDLFSGLKSIQSGATTNVDLIESFIKELNKYQPKKIFIADSGNKESVNYLFKEMGYYDLQNKYENVELLDLDQAPLILLIGDTQSILGNMEINEKLLEIDNFVNFANLKANVVEKISGCWLNHFSYLSNAEQKNNWFPFIKSINIELFKTFRPTLSVLDASIILKNMGPVEGYPISINQIIASNHPLLADIVGTKLLNINFKKIPSLSYAATKLKLSKEIKEKVSSILPQTKRIEEITGLYFYFFRFSLAIERLAYYLKNLSRLLFLGSLVLISIGGKDLVTGKWMSFNNYFKIAREIIIKIGKTDNLLNWKIAINKHVKEKTLS